MDLQKYLATILASLLLIANVNGLANCPPGCQCDDNTLVVQCGEGELDVLPIALNPSIQRLVIKNNKIKIIDSSIQFYAELTFLDLSSNHLMTIPNRTFAYQKKLQEVHLNHNKIGQISNKTFVGLSAVIVLNLRGNQISELHQGTFSPLMKIEELNLGENRINYIDPRAFEGLNQLRLLYLDDNALTSVPDPIIFQNIPNIAELFLGSNYLVHIPSGSFQDLKSLTHLDLKSCSLNNLTHDSFKGLESMRVLELADNRLQRIPTVTLSNLVRLEDLSLGQNDFEVVVEGAFVGLKQLKRLDISGSLRLKKVMNGAFAANTNLEYLNLSANKMLNEVQEGSLSGLPHLKHVVMKTNALTTLAEGLFPWKDLKTLDISENPIVCDCRVMWLRNLLLSKNTSTDDISEVLCEYPEHLKGESLKVLNPTLMGCSHTDPRKQALIGALLVGSAATITAITLIIYRCRRKIRAHFNGGLLGNSALGRKEREYQKTFCDDDFMTRHHNHPCSLGIHSTFPHNYASHNPAVHHYGMCSINNDINNENQKNFQQLQVSTNTLMHEKKSSLKSTPTPLDDRAPFMMHMKPSFSSHQNLNHYTQPQFSSSSATTEDSCYSYADITTPHTKNEQRPFHLTLTQDLFNDEAQSEEPLHYDTSPTYRNNLRSDDIIDPNYIYSNTYYSTPLEQIANRSKSSVPSPQVPPSQPPALPQRNGLSGTSGRHQRQTSSRDKSLHNTLPNVH